MKTIAILAGGNSSERKISLKTAYQIFENIDKSKYTPYVVDVKGKKWDVLLDGKRFPVDKNTFTCKKGRKTLRFDFAWIAIHGTPGENGQMQGYLDMMQIPYSSCDLLVSALTFNKHACKEYLQNSGVAMAKSVLVKQGEPIDYNSIVNHLQLPVFVKPNTSGSSFGVSKVKQAEELPVAIENAFCEDHEVIIESFIKGTEVSCGVFKSKSKSYVLPVTEIVSPNEFFDYHAKYFSKETQEITPARISEEITQKVQYFTSLVYDRLRCKGIVRVDFIIQDGTPYFLELNSVPGMSRESIIPRQLRTAGIAISDFLSEVIEDAIQE